MIAKYNRISLLFGVPGIALQIAGRLVIAEPVLGAVTSLAGTVLLLVGLAYYAKAKGRSPWWCLLAFLSIIGLAWLGLLKDKSESDEV